MFLRGVLSGFLWLSLCLGPGQVFASSGGKGPRTTPSAASPRSKVSIVPFMKSMGYRNAGVDGDYLSLYSRTAGMRFKNGSRKWEAGDVTVYLNDGVKRSGRTWQLSQVDVDKTVRPLLRPNASLERLGYRVIVLDPGHGGTDPGAVSANGLKEKDVTLDIAKKMRVHLQKAGYKVYLTREDDRLISLKNRARKAKDVKADLFLSIHCNAVAGNRAASGIETFVLSIPGFNSTNARPGAKPTHIRYPGNQFDGANMIFGYNLQKTLINEQKAEDRGVRRARFLVLKELSCPGALVEIGFLSNPKEAGRLSVQYFRQKMALSLCRGVEMYFRDVKRALVQGSNVAASKEKERNAL